MLQRDVFTKFEEWDERARDAAVRGLLNSVATPYIMVIHCIVRARTWDARSQLILIMFLPLIFSLIRTIE